VEGKQKSQILTIRKSLDVRVSVITKHVSALVEDDPHRPDRLCRIEDGDLIVASVEDVFVRLGRYRSLKNDALRGCLQSGKQH